MMPFIILLFRILYLVFLLYVLVSLLSIFLVHFFRKFAPVHTHSWAFGISMFSKVCEGLIGFYLFSQMATFFFLDLGAISMHIGLKYFLGFLFLAVWIFQMELHKGRESFFLDLEGSNYIKFDYDLYNIKAIKLSLVSQIFGSLGFVGYLAYTPHALQNFLHPYFKVLVFF